MKPSELVGLYANDTFIKLLAEPFKQTAEPQHLQIKGLAGSLDALLAATLFQHVRGCHLFIVNDKDDAAYFFNDLQHLMPEQEILLFPMSYKKPYQFEEVDNANVLMRTEVLNKLNANLDSGLLVVTYPEALAEKVINKRSLQSNTLTIRVGERLDTAFVAELLNSYEFEKTDFVYEAGQYSVRGGIIDIFSFASEFPVRVDLFGDEVESIRTFNPETQLSADPVAFINIIPNIQTHLIQESRESFLSFFPKHTTLWAKDIPYSVEVLEQCFESAVHDFDSILAASGGIQVISKPDDLFENRRTFLPQLKEFRTVEFGRKFYFKSETRQTYTSKVQPSFNKDFVRLADTLGDLQSQGYTCIIAAESFKQLDRLQTIIEEIDPMVRFQPLNIGLREGFIDEILKVVCFTDHQVFDRYFRYRSPEKFSKSKALTLRDLKNLQPGDYVTHVDHGIGRFAGLERVDNAGNEQEAIRLIYRDNDMLLVSIHSLHKIARYSGREGTPPTMSKLGSPEWDQKKSRVRKQVKEIARELISLYAKRRTAPGFAFSRDTYLQAELESSFLYEDTPDQAKATSDVKDDMEKPHPMDRLICGDVGFGKTEVAIRAAFKAVSDGKQVAVLVPTTILAMQHYRTFSERMADFPVTINYINRFRSATNTKEILKDAASGQLNILIGTHRIVNKDVQFKNLGLLIIDEEQKFGVKTKDRLKEMRVEVDVLTLTATPIPRTLHFSLMGARDLSVIATPPPNRQPVTTEVRVFDEAIIRDAISAEIRRSGQVFFVHNRISDIESLGNTIKRLVPEARIGVAHGQMEGERLERVMTRFIEGEFDVLISTNIIESGLDIPNANTILVNNAHFFGLSDLHQMRGRVGRSNRKAFCYLLTPPPIALTADARKRLQTLEDFSDLGEGFKIAMRDLDIRGAGNLLGAEQSGFINDLGFEMYHKVLDEAVQELREQEFKDLFATDAVEVLPKLPDTVIETDLSVVIPERYVFNISERLSLYTRLDSLENEEQLQVFRQELTDRFGPLPDEVLNLIKLVSVRWKAERLYLEKLTLKNTILKAHFVSNGNDAFFNSEQFGRVIDYIKSHPSVCSLKEVKGKLIFTHTGIQSVEELETVLTEITH